MSIRFASPRPAASVLAGTLGRARLQGRAANDNAPAGRDAVLRDALKHFAQHGLRAAQVARDLAVEADRLGDDATRDHWIEICRTLDRRMAVALCARIGLTR